MTARALGSISLNSGKAETIAASMLMKIRKMPNIAAGKLNDKMGNDQKQDSGDQHAAHRGPLGAESVGERDDDELADDLGRRNHDGDGAQGGQDQAEAIFHPETVVDIEDLVRSSQADGEEQREYRWRVGADNTHGRQGIHNAGSVMAPFSRRRFYKQPEHDRAGSEQEGEEDKYRLQTADIKQETSHRRGDDQRQSPAELGDAHDARAPAEMDDIANISLKGWVIDDLADAESKHDQDKDAVVGE